MAGKRTGYLCGLWWSDDLGRSGNAAAGDKIKVGVFLYKFDDTYISTVRQNLEKIAGENSDKVEFTFYDGKGDQATQNDSMD